MKRMLALLCILFSLFLTGCGFKSGDEFYALPKASDVYKSLEICLQQVLDQGMEYSAPVAGTNTRSVHLQDLDGDGEDEAIGFFRDTSGKKSPLNIYFFKKDAEEKYHIAGHISGDGTAINSATTCQFEGDSNSPSELAVSWQVSSGVYALSTYSISEYDGEYAITEMMPSTSYTRYIIQDMDEDGEDELLLINLDASDSGTSVARCFDLSNARLEELSSVPLSNSMGAVDKVHASTLSDGSPAIYITGLIQSDTISEVVTDILSLQGGTLRNITLDAKQLSSTSTTRYNLAPDQDINGDGIWEIPTPKRLPSHNPESTETFYAVEWRQFARDGSSTLLNTCYYNSTDGWYLDLPEDWNGHISLARSDNSDGPTNERGIVFYFSQEGSEPTPALAIYKNTGNDRADRATIDGRMLLLSNSDTTYSAKLWNDGSEVDNDTNELFAHFHLITTDWSSN